MTWSMTASGRCVRESSSSDCRIAGQPIRKQIVHPLHASVTASGRYAAFAVGSSAHSSWVMSTAGPSSLSQVLSCFSRALTS